MCTLQASDLYNITKTPGKSLHLLMFIFTEILFQTGLVSSEEFLSVQREDVVGSHIRETAKKASVVLSKAAGGTLLVDEAYRLVPPDSPRDYGLEAVGTIMAVIEGGNVTTTKRPALIFAGYAAEMNHFIYTIQLRNGKTGDRHFLLPRLLCCGVDMMEILYKMAATQDYCISEPASALVHLVENKFSLSSLSQHNAGFSSRLYRTARKFADSRIVLFYMESDDITLGDVQLTTLILDFKRAVETIHL